MIPSLIDTGSCVSLINASFIDENSVTSYYLDLVAVNGQKLKPLGKTTIKFKILGEDFSWSFVVLRDCNFHCIIGRDFLKAQNFCIDLNNQEILIKPSNAKMATLSCYLKPNTLDEEVIKKWSHVFSNSCSDNGFTNVTCHRINTENHEPIKIRPYRIPNAQREEMKDIIDELIKTDVIRHSNSPWCSPAILVKKKDGSKRLCIDYRKLNSITKKDCYSLPIIEELIDRLSGAKFFSLLDLKSGFWQCAVNKEDVEKTAFSPAPGLGLYEFNVMPFGLTNAPSTFQRLMDKVLGQSDHYSAYLDDIIIFSKDYQSHLSHLEEVFCKLSKAGLRVKKSKCNFGLSKINYLGFIVSKDGVRPDPTKIEPIMNWKKPQGVKELQSFIGTCGYYHKFIENFATISFPLYNLLKKSVSWTWDRSANNAFETLKTKISQISTLNHPNWKIPFNIHCDASDVAVGAVLSQTIDGMDKPVAFFSKTLSVSQQKYSTSDRECLSIVLAIKKFRYYLYGNKFVVYTDHDPLKYLKTCKNISGKRARWILDLEEYDFEIKYIPGHKNTVADGLSRSICAVEFCSSLNMEQEQKKDPKLGIIINCLSSNNLPVESIDRETNHLVKMLKRLSIEKNVLCHKSRRGIRPIMPNHLRKSVFESCHVNSLAHAGINKTKEAIRCICFWPNMDHDITSWISKCYSCQTNKHKNYTPKSLLKPLLPSHLQQFWEVDFTGPLPTTLHGNRYIIVFINIFTKWVEALAVPDQTAATASKALIECIVSRYGIPDQLHSDQGRQFESEIFKNLCSRLGINKTRTTPYHPSGNGNVERSNRTIKEMLRHFVNSYQNDWDFYLPIVLLAIRSSQHSSTKFSPAELTLGRNLRTPTHVEFSPNSQVNSNSYNDSQDLIKNFEKIWKIAEENIRKAQQNYKSYHDIDSKNLQLKPGDYVLTKSQRQNKLQPLFTGPHMILDCKHPTYKISDGQDLSKHHIIHHDHLYQTSVKPHLTGG